MTLAKFAESSGLLEVEETKKAELLTYFFYKSKGKEEVAPDDLVDWFRELGLAAPNKTRLRRKLEKSKRFIRSGEDGYFRLHARVVQEYDSQFPWLKQKDETVVSDDIILPEDLFVGTRGYIEKLARQINACFEYNIFDGCAVLMRRLMEILLIHVYKFLGFENEIKGSGDNYHPLEKIIDDAIGRPELDLSRDTKKLLDTFRELGNFSAHKIQYNARRGDIKRYILRYRAVCEELLYKANLLN